MTACTDDACQHYTCDGCGNDVCPDRAPSPGEPEVCAACVDAAVVA